MLTPSANSGRGLCSYGIVQREKRDAYKGESKRQGEEGGRERAKKENEKEWESLPQFSRLGTQSSFLSFVGGWCSLLSSVGL